ncbi:hypothetical protein SDRG_17445, partial [Saprolegnia diclina VS20]
MERTSSTRTTLVEFNAMTSFLQVPDNFDILSGKGSKTKQLRNGQRLTVRYGYKLLADYVNQLLASTGRQWTEANAK